MSNKLKLLIVFSFCSFITLNCSRFSYETNYLLRPEIKTTAEDEWKTLISNASKSPKIVLVGFRGYRIAKSVSDLRKTEYYAELDYDHGSYPFFKNARYIDEFKNAKAIPVDQKNVERFVIEYLKVTETSGKKEIEKLLVPVGENYQIRKTNADYIIVALHTPYYHERATNAAINSITGFLGILTLGTIPIYEESLAESSFAVYDGNLNYLSTFLYKRNYLIRSAWWMWPNEGFQTFFNQQETPPINAYKIHVEEFEREFLRNLNSLKSSNKK